MRHRHQGPKVAYRTKRGRVAYRARPIHNNKFQKVMGEFKQGKLKSSSGKRVTDRNQAIAIAFSEQRKASKHDWFDSFKKKKNTVLGEEKKAMDFDLEKKDDRPARMRLL